MEKTVLGFDFGLKYIGVAVGQSITQTASPLETLLAKDGIPNWEDIQILITRWQPTELIVGVPLNMDGSTQRMTHCAKRFIHRLQDYYKLPVHEVDERLSSWEITHTEKKTRQSHSHVACLLIEQWFQKAD